MNSKPTEPLSLAVLLSGGGRTLRNLISCIDKGQLAARINLVISSNPDAGGVAIAQDANIPVCVVSRKERADVRCFSRAVFDAIRKAEVGLVCLAGYLCLLEMPDDFAGRVINIHPALLPDYGGKGMHGMQVHEAVLAARETTSGCTVHFVDDQYDHGPIILQRRVPVNSDDTPQSLATRVFVEECIAYPDAIRQIIAGQCKP